MAQTAEAVKKAARPVRVPLGVRNRLSFGNLDPNYVYRVINDKDTRLKDAQAAGYEFVQSNEQLGDIRVAEGSAMDSRVSKPVGGGTTGYLMRIPKEFYEEDQAAKETKILATEDAMKPKKGQIGEGLTHE